MLARKWTFRSRPLAISPFLATIATAALMSPGCDGARRPIQVPPPTAPSAAPRATASALPAPAHADVSRTIDADDAEIAKAAQAYVDLIVETDPEEATQLGIHTRDAELTDRSAQAVERNLARKERMLTSLRDRFKKPRASMTAQTDLELLTHALAVEIRVARDRKPHARQPDVYFRPLDAIFAMMVRDYAPAAERANNVLARMEKLPTVLAAAKQNVKEPPKVFTQIGIERAAGAREFLDEQAKPLKKMLPGQSERIDAAIAKAKAAYVDYKQFLERDVMPRSKGDYAVGKEHFDFLLRENFFLDEDSDAVLARGKAIFAKTEQQMNELAKKIDPKATSWVPVVAKLKAHHPTADKLLDAYRFEVARVRKFLVDKDAIELPPGDELEVMATPAYLRSIIGSAAYDMPPPFDEGTKGIFFATPIDTSLPPAKQEEMLRENDHGDLVDTAVHEAYPGHHLQHSFARLHPSTIRKVLGSALFAEGWALYSEELLAELGYYTDEERMMQLEWTLVRAARVVLDVGLHVKKMTFDEAVKVLTEQVHLERPLALSEVKRYAEHPTQPLSYLTGREMIFKLRERYKKEQADRYTLKAFHEELLSHGTIPVGLIEKEMFSR
jgi:uncharacterized protein (DUF885 family)